MHNIKRPKIIHCGDLVCAVFRWARAWSLIDGQPIVGVPFGEELARFSVTQDAVFFCLLRRTKYLTSLADLVFRVT